MSSIKKINVKTIAIIILSCLDIIGIIVLAILIIYPPRRSSVVTNTSSAYQPLSESAQAVKTDFESITKDEAMKFLLSRGDNNGAVPEGYVGDEIIDSEIIHNNLIFSDIELAYSHDNVEDLKNTLAERMLTEPSKLRVEDYPYYVIVKSGKITPEMESCNHGYNRDCDSQLSFKTKYLNHYGDTHQTEGGSWTYTEPFVMNTRDPEEVCYILRVLSFFSVHRGNIYSYYFEETDDEFILTVNYVGAGYNLELYDKIMNGEIDSSAIESDADMLGINLYQKHYTASKQDGSVGSIEETNLKSFSITEEEFNSLPGYGADE